MTGTTLRQDRFDPTRCTIPLCRGVTYLDGSDAVSKGRAGNSCNAEPRVIDIVRYGAQETRFLSDGDDTEIWTADANGRFVLGKLSQKADMI